MGCTFFIYETVYILLLLPSLNCEVCGTLLLLNTEQINRGDNVRLEFSSKYIRNDTSLVSWWKYLQTTQIRINTSLQRFHIDVQQASVTLTIHNVTTDDSGEYTAVLVNIQCSPPMILVSVREPNVLSTIPQFPDNATIPELGCDKCLVGTVGVYMKVECFVFGISKKDTDMELILKQNGRKVPNVNVDGSPWYRAVYDYMPSEEDTDHTVSCEAARDGQHPETVSITLIVLRKPLIATITLPDSIKEGKNATISCQTFNARPEPRLYFMYNSRTYNTNNSFSKSEGDKTVNAETILEKSFGRYDNTMSIYCCVEFKEYYKSTRKMKTKCSTSTINVLFKPFISFSPSSSITTSVGDSISVLCQCDANPAAKIEWSNTTPNNIGKRTGVSLELNMQFQSTGRHNFTCTARNTIGSVENVVFILVEENTSEPTNPITRPTSRSTGKVTSSSMLIRIICGCLAIVLIVIIAFICVIVWKTRKEIRRENVLIMCIYRSDNHPQHNDPAGFNHGDGPSKAIAEPVEYTSVV